MTLQHLAADGARMADLARGDLTVAVPTCPDWTLQDLIEHTGMVHRWQTAAVRTRATTFPDPPSWQIGPADGESWADWFQAGVDDAVAVLADVAPDEPIWNWSPSDHTAGWYQVRCPQETSVHRVDAELAATGEATPIEPAFAVEGITEMFEVFVPASGEEEIGGSGETLELHATDVVASWRVTLGATRVTIGPVGDAPDAVVRASAGELLLFVWGREPLWGRTVTGDQATHDRFFAAAKT